MTNLLISTFQTFNEILTAGIAITAFSLLVYALTFNLRDRVARSFATILFCVMVVFAGEALGTTAAEPDQIEFWLRLQWVGILLLPAAYLHFSDALLETTGRPSRGRRRLLVRLMYVLAIGLMLTLRTSWLVGPLVLDGQPAPHLERTRLTAIFTFIYIGAVAFAWVNFWRAYRRTVTRTSQRRMRYLLAGALAPALGSYPYLLYGSEIGAAYPWIFWGAAILSNLFVTVLLVVMAYAVAFFGVSWPDRVVKRRLFKWLMRGPVTASTVLALTTMLRRWQFTQGVTNSALVPVLMVVTVLVMEHLITFLAPLVERILFQGWEEGDLRLIQNLEERLLTTRDLRQFLESVLAAICDQLQISTAFVAALGSQGLEFVVHVGPRDRLPSEGLSSELLLQASNRNGTLDVFAWSDYWLLPLMDPSDEGLLGILGVLRTGEDGLPEAHRESLQALAQRAALALQDRRAQQQVFTSLKDLTPQVELIQRLRAAASYDRSGILADLETLPGQADLPQVVKDALSHYWGGPKLTNSPLMRLKVVEQALDRHNGNPVNALRSILREAIERVRPEGERRFTAEWILYNILELKFMEGRKVREVAMRLAMSEADLYRKQRVAIEAVADAIMDMEVQARESQAGDLEVTPQTLSAGEL